MSDQYQTYDQQSEHGETAEGKGNDHSRSDSALLRAIDELTANTAANTAPTASDAANLPNGLRPTAGPSPDLEAIPPARQEPPAGGGDPILDSSIQEGTESDPRLALSARLAGAMPTARPQFRDDLRQELLRRHPANSIAPTPAKALRMNGSLAQTGRNQAVSPSPVPTYSNARGRRLVASWAAGAVGLALLALLFIGLSTMFKVRQGRVVAGGTPTEIGAVAIHPQNTGDSAETAIHMQPLVTLKSGPAGYIVWSPDGSRLAIAEVTKSEYLENYMGNNHPLDTYLLHIFDTGTTEQLGSATLEDISSIEWSPDSSLLAVGLDRFKLKIYGRDGNERYSMSTPFPELGTKAANGSGWGKFTSLNNTGNVAVAWSPDGRLLASAAGEPYSQTPVLSADGAVRLWNPATGQLATTIKIPADPSSIQNDESNHPLSPGWVKRVQWTPGGHLFLPDGAGVWDPATGRRTQELADLKGTNPGPSTTSPYILAGQWSPDGSAFAFADDIFIRLCDPVTGQLQRSLPDALPPSPLPSEAPKVPLSQEEGMAAMATAEADAAENGYEPIYSFLWSPDSRQIANASSSGSIRTWDVAAGRRLLTIQTQTNLIAWSPDGKVLVSEGFPLTFPGVGNGDQQPPANGVDLWDATNGKLLRHIADDQAGSFAWSPSEPVLAISMGAGVQLWGIPSSYTPTQSPTPSTPPTPSKNTLSVERNPH